VFAQGEIEQFHASGNHPRPRARRGGRKLLLHVNFAMVSHYQMPAFAQMMLHLPLLHLHQACVLARWHLKDEQHADAAMLCATIFLLAF